MLATGLNGIRPGVRSLSSRPLTKLILELPVPVIPLEYIWLTIMLKLSVRMYRRKILKFLWSLIIVETYSLPDEKKV